MEADFIVFFIKMTLFSMLYGTIISLTTYYTIKKNKIFCEVKYNTIWKIFTLSIFIVFLINIMFGNGFRGMGLFRVLHIDNNKVVKQDRMRSIGIDGKGEVYIDPKNNFYVIGKFKVENEIVYAELVQNYKLSNKIICWNTKTDSIIITNKDSKTPTLNTSFSEYYEQYWNGWRLWLLP